MLKNLLENKSKGLLFVISAPSGTGKTSLIKKLIQNDNELQISISHTTRYIRPSEKNGVDYHFIDKPTFEKMIQENNFLEHASVYENYYGTSKKWVEEQLDKNIDVILEIDVQGATNIKKLIPDSISIFILPPSLQTLEERLHSRNEDKPEYIKQRLNVAKTEISCIDNYDYVLVNDNFEVAFNKLNEIIKTSRLKLSKKLDSIKDILSDFE